MSGSREETLRANGLLHHVIRWEPAGTGAAPAATILCAHGFLDVGFSFRQVAERLVAKGHRVIAFDWRGHGESEWVGAGGYYHFMDYVADLADLVRQLVPGPLHLVGHSMGGTAAALFAGSFPERVEKLILLEGLGPEEGKPVPLPVRAAKWVDSVRMVRERAPRVMATLEEALGRMRIQNPSLSDELGLELAGHSTAPVDGGFRWSFDPIHQTRGPYPFRTENFIEFLRAIRAPTLLVDGSEGYRAADQADRRAALPHAKLLELPEVGHMMHWFAPDQVAAAIHDFVTCGEVPGASADAAPSGLRAKRCVPCEGGVPKLGPAEQAPLLREVPGWRSEDDRLRREFVFANFVEAMAFLDRVAALAEDEGHHPDFTVHYNKVDFTIWTHAIGGLSENDFILAAKIDELAAAARPNGGAEHEKGR